MPSTPLTRRPGLQRTNSWPPTVRVEVDGPKASKPRSGSMSTTVQTRPSYDPFEDDLEDHPEDYFLTPIYEYEDWADSDEDDEEVEWDAGITDFALFDTERRRAQETHEQLPSKWDSFMSRQASALQRAVRRNQSDPNPDPRNRPLSSDDVPALTPDNSPDMRDDLDDEPRTSVPSYLSVVVTPPAENDNGISRQIEDAMLTVPLRRAILRKDANGKLERPGLRYNRTMSGKAHVWRRPSWEIYPVCEDPEAEATAALDGADVVEGEDDGRGRRA